MFILGVLNCISGKENKGTHLSGYPDPDAVRLLDICPVILVILTPDDLQAGNKHSDSHKCKASLASVCC